MAKIASSTPTIVNIDTLKSLNGTPVRDVSRQKSVNEIVAGARFAFKGGRTKSLDFRRKQLNNLLRMFDENMELMEEALKKDLGKHKQEAQILDLFYSRNVVVKTLANLKRWTESEYPNRALINFWDKIKIQKDPYGVVLILSAWNFPFNLLFCPFIGALAAGNCCILKPSEMASASADLIAELVPKYLDNDCYKVFLGGISETTELLAERFDYIFYTGSTYVGRIIHAAANKHLTPVTLELGGKSPVYLDESVNLHVAARRILWGKVSNSGQICISPDYLLCNGKIQKKFVSAAKEILREWFGEDVQASSSYSRLISDKHYKRLTQFLNDKSKIAIGGKSDANDLFLEPTILSNVSPNDPIMQEEIFGPILPIVVVENPVEAINFINAGEKPLIMYIFSNEGDVKEAFLKNTSSGTILFNDTIVSFQAEALPFGGVGYSGMGGYHGKHTVDAFSHKKGVFESNYISLVEKIQSSRYPPYSDAKIAVIKNLLSLRYEIDYGWLKTLFVFFCGIIFMLLIQYVQKALNKKS